MQTFRRHLGQNGIAAGSHIRRRDGQLIGAVLVEHDCRGSHVHVRDTGALHGHTHAYGAYLAISHIPGRVFFLPANHFAGPDQTLVQTAALCHLAEISRHKHLFPHHIFQAELHRIHVKNGRQLIYDGFQGKDSLGGSIPPVRACGKLIRVDYVKYMTEGL